MMTDAFHRESAFEFDSLLSIGNETDQAVGAKCTCPFLPKSIPLTPPPRSARRRGPGRLLVEMVSMGNRRETTLSHRWCIEINLFSGKFLVFGRLKCCGCLRSCTSHDITLRGDTRGCSGAVGAYFDQARVHHRC